MLPRLQDTIRASGGWISFARYMELVLYDPGLGAWIPVSPMGMVRTRHSATLLPAGDVLVAGEGPPPTSFAPPTR